MQIKWITYILSTMLSLGTSSVFADHTETVIGAAVGGAAGAAIGNRTGGRNDAVIWSAIGGATGAIVGRSLGDPHERQVVVRERVRYVVIPHLIPLTTFIALMQLMDNFRVLEPIVGFSAEANATSLSFLVYNDLRGAETPLFGSAGATSMLTIFGVIILLMPVLIRTSRDFNRKAQ